MAEESRAFAGLTNSNLRMNEILDLFHNRNLKKKIAYFSGAFLHIMHLRLCTVCKNSGVEIFLASHGLAAEVNQ